MALQLIVCPRPPDARVQWFRGVVVLAAAIVALAIEPHLWPAMPVPVSVVDAGPVATVRRNILPATLTAGRRLQLGPDVGGRVARMLVQPGDWVTRGGVLLTLDRAATASELTARRRLLADARTVQRDQCASVVLAADRVVVARALAGLGLQSSLSIAVAQDHQEDADRACDAAAGWVDWATVALTQAQEDDAATTLRAPFDALVSRVNAQPGAVLARREPVVDLLDSSTLFVTAPFDAGDARDLQPGAPVRLTTMAPEPVSVGGTVRRIRPSDDEGEGDAVVVDIAPAGAIPRGWATPGARIDAAITVIREAAARIPAAALVDRGAVLVIRNGRVMKVAVEVGLAGGEFVEVTAGLAAGDPIVLSPLWPLLMPGMRVRPIDRSAPDSR